MTIVLNFLLGILLRIGVPLIITGLLLVWLHNLDKHWQKEVLTLPVVPTGKPCWEIKDCPEQTSRNCPAFADPTTPCWQVFRTKDGVMKETCLGCSVFRQAPIPTRI